MKSYKTVDLMLHFQQTNEKGKIENDILILFFKVKQKIIDYSKLYILQISYSDAAIPFWFLMILIASLIDFYTKHSCNYKYLCISSQNLYSDNFVFDNYPYNYIHSNQ